MKVSPLSPPLAVTEQEDGPRHDDLDAANNCGLKRRRLHSQTNIINNHFRHRKHVYPRHDNRSTSTGCFNDSNSSCNSGNSGGDASDCDDSSNTPVKQHPAEEGTSSPSSRHNKIVCYIMTRRELSDSYAHACIHIHMSLMY